MVDFTLAEILRKQLTASGAALVGFANLEVLDPEVRHGFPVGISIAVPLDPDIISSITDGPTKDYEAEYHRTNALLGELASKCAGILGGRGHKALPFSATEVELDRATLRSPLPHKTTATRAALGWIGKCALLITETYGSAVRITTVLTDAPLPVASPIEESRCGSCTECVDTCPGSAPSGNQWQAGTIREDIYDAFACATTAKDLSTKQGIPHFLCGMCITACPWTKRYLSGR